MRTPGEEEVVVEEEIQSVYVNSGLWRKSLLSPKNLK